MGTDPACIGFVLLTPSYLPARRIIVMLHDHLAGQLLPSLLNSISCLPGACHSAGQKAFHQVLLSGCCWLVCAPSLAAAQWLAGILLLYACRLPGSSTPAKLCGSTSSCAGWRSPCGLLLSAATLSTSFRQGHACVVEQPGTNRPCCMHPFLMHAPVQSCCH